MNKKNRRQPVFFMLIVNYSVARGILERTAGLGAGFFCSVLFVGLTGGVTSAEFLVTWQADAIKRQRPKAKMLV